MARVHFMRWAPQDWRTSKVRARSIRTRDPLLRLLYLELLFVIHEAGGSVPSDPDHLQDLVDLPADVIAKRLPPLLELGRTGNGGIVCEEGRLYNRRVTSDLAERRAFCEARSRAGKASGQKRSEKAGTNTCSTGVQQVFDTVEPSYSYSSSTSSPTHTDPDPERARARGERERREQSAEADFERIWQTYPEEGRKARPMAERAWVEKLEFAPPIGEVLMAIIRQKKSEQWAKRRAIPALEKWIREARWADAVPTGDGASSRYKPLE